MLRIVLATTRPDVFHSFTDALQSDPSVQLDVVGSGAVTLDAVRTSPPHLVVIDHDLPDTDPFRLVQKLLMANAMVNTAVVSSLSEEDFHGASEGLGILCSLPVELGGSDAGELLAKLKKLQISL